MTVLRRLKSPHGRQLPSLFLTIWSGDDQGLSDRLTMPSLSNCKNSALAASSFSPSRRRKRQLIGGPLVAMKCSTPVEAAGRDLEGFTTSLNSCKNNLHQSGDSGGTTVATQAGWLGGGGDWREREANRDSTVAGGILAANKEPLRAAGGGRGGGVEVEMAADECGSAATAPPTVATVAKACWEEESTS